MGSVSHHKFPETLQLSKGSSDVSEDEWHIATALTISVMPLFHQYFFLNFPKKVQ